MKIRSIQYWRAIAALMVVVAHSLLHPLPFPTPSLRRLGSFGVLLFFVISGFIMVYTTGKGRFAPGNFLRRRIERIVPLYWLVTGGVVILALLAPGVLRNTTFSFSQLLMSCLFIPYARSNGEIVPLMKLGWTLNYEMFFYLSFAAMAWVRTEIRVAALTVFFLILIALGQWIAPTAAIPYFFTRPVILTFCVGMGIGLWHLHHGDKAASRLSPLLLAASAAALTLAGFLVTPDSAINPPTDSLFTLAAGALVLLGLRVENRMPASRPGLLLGEASYALYLVHMYVVAAVLLIVHRLTGASLPWLEVPLAIGLSILSAILVLVLIERPIGRWLRGWRTGKRGKDKALPPPGEPRSYPAPSGEPL